MISVIPPHVPVVVVILFMMQPVESGTLRLLQEQPVIFQANSTRNQCTTLTPKATAPCYQYQGGAGACKRASRNVDVSSINNFNGNIDEIKTRFRHMFHSPHEVLRKQMDMYSCNGYQPEFRNYQTATPTATDTRRRKRSSPSDNNSCCPAASYFMAVEKLEGPAPGDEDDVYPFQFDNLTQLIPVKHCEGIAGDCDGTCVPDVQPVSLLAWCFGAVECPKAEDICGFHTVMVSSGCVCRQTT